MLCALCMIVVNASSSLSYCIDREDQDVRGRRMDFYTVLDQVLALLRQRGRVSYRALKRQFQLDDETLADLTAELLYAHHPVGEEGSGLVWLGEASTAPEGPSPVLQPETPRPVQDTPSTRSAFPLRLHLALRRNAASSRCCFVTWSTRRPLLASSTPKTCGRSCAPIRPRAPR